RMTRVATRRGVDWFDDSKATNVGAAVKSLESFAQSVVLLAGGVDKGGSYAPLADAAAGKVRVALVFGAARAAIAAALLARDVAVEDVPSLEAAVRAAAAHARPGDVVLLAPACSSFDMFADYAARGRAFRAAAEALGTAACVVASQLSSETYRRAAYPLLGASVLALVLVLVPGIGLVRGGARRWLHLGPLSLQPSEAAKVALVLYLARSLSKKGERVHDFVVGVVPHCLVVGFVAGLLLLEPDFGTAALAAALLFLMLFAGGVRARHLAVPVIAALPLVVYEATGA